MKGTLKFPMKDAAAAVPEFIGHLTNAFYELVPRDLEVRGAQIKVRGGMFRWASSFNLLTALTAVTVTAAAEPRDLTVTYDISFLETFVFCVAATIFFVPTIMAQKVPWFMLPTTVAMVWGGLFWTYRHITRFRVRFLLREIAEETARAQAG
jgi:hypothetical protein